MAQKPLAVNDFIIRDANSITGTGNNHASRTIYSILNGAIGLPGSSAQYANRYGKWPIASGLNRPGSRLTLETHFLECTSILRYAQRRLLLTELNPELEDLTRLLASDTIPPEGLLLALGPWDVYEKTAGTWHCRHLLWPDIDAATIEADITGAVHFEDGEQSRQRAVVIEAETTSLVDNPSFEIDTTNWAANGAASIARDTAEHEFGQASVKVTVTAVASDGIRRTGGAVISIVASTTYTYSVSFKGVAGQSYTIRFDGDISGTIVTQDFTATGDWQRESVTGTMGAGDSTVQLFILNASAIAHDFWADGFQFEQLDHATTYCDGSRGPGYAWSGTPHASGSTSIRTATVFDLDDEISLINEKDTLTFRVVAQMQYDADGDWPGAAGISHLWDARGANDSNRFYLEFDHGAGDNFRVWINGAFRLDGPAETFNAGDWLDIIVTLDFENDSYKLYTDAVLDDTDTGSFTAPILTTWKLGTQYDGSDRWGNFIFAEYMTWDRVLDAAEIADLNTNGASAGRARYLNVECESSPPLIIDGRPTDRGNTSGLAVDKEVRWRSRDGDFAAWQPVASPWNLAIDVDSDDEIYPEFRITPDIAKTAGNGFQYRRFVRIEWNASLGAVKYPILIGPIDTTTLVPAKMQADGDDWRIYVDGFEVDRWFGGASGAAGGPNSATTKTWINLDFAPQESVTLATSIGAVGAITEIESEDDISGFPSSGLLLIDSEIFYYTSKNDTDKKFLGVTREVRNTTAAAHTGGTAAVEWIQHDVFIVYGNSTLTAPTIDDLNEPAFNLGTSTNGSWVYADFGEDAKLRAAQWDYDIITQPSNERTTFNITTANNFTYADPWVEMGIDIQMYNGGPSGTPVVDKAGARWRIFNPCGMTNANFQNGNNFTSSDDGSQNKVYIQSSEDGSAWNDETIISGNPWNINQALDAAGADKWVGMIGTTELFQGLNSDSNRGARIEVADVTLTIYASTAPSSTINAEENNYTLAATIENVTTGESITLDFATMLLDETLVVNTYEKTITYLVDGSSQQQILTLDSGARRDWLRLLPGENNLTYTDAGTQKVDIEILWHRRDWE